MYLLTCSGSWGKLLGSAVLTHCISSLSFKACAYYSVCKPFIWSHHSFWIWGQFIIWSALIFHLHLQCNHLTPLQSGLYLHDFTEIKFLQPHQWFLLCFTLSNSIWHLEFWSSASLLRTGSQLTSTNCSFMVSGLKIFWRAPYPSPQPSLQFILTFDPMLSCLLLSLLHRALEASATIFIFQIPYAGSTPHTSPLRASSDTNALFRLFSVLGVNKVSGSSCLNTPVSSSPQLHVITLCSLKCSPVLPLKQILYFSQTQLPHLNSSMKHVLTNPSPIIMLTEVFHQFSTSHNLEVTFHFLLLSS